MFHFKQFSLSDEISAMKIGTDAVLLGAWVNCANAQTILDIGTGTGILALMMAQRTNARINAVDISELAANEAKKNSELSPWKNRVEIIQIAFQQYSDSSNQKFDLIISNPPFFSNSLKSPDPLRTVSRHDEMLPFNELVIGAVKILNHHGQLNLILPAENLESRIKSAAASGLFPWRICSVISRDGKPAVRSMIEFRLFQPDTILQESITIRNRDGSYTEEYKKLTCDFYLGL